MGYIEWYVNSGVTHPVGDNNRALVYPDQSIKNVQQICCVEANIPFTYYAVLSTNNQFYITEYASSTPGGGGTPLLVTIPPGNYTPSDIITLLPSYLTAAGATGSAYTVTYNKVLNKLTIVSGTKFFDLSFVTTNTVARVLGFNATSTYANTQSVTSPNALALGGPDTLLLRSNMAPTAACMMVGNASFAQNIGGNILAFIPVLSTPGNYTKWSNLAADGGFIDIGSADISTAEFWFTSGENTLPIDFNGSFWSLKVGLRTRATDETSPNTMEGAPLQKDASVEARPRITKLVYDPNTGHIEEQVIESAQEMRNLQNAWVHDSHITFIPVTKQSEDLKKFSHLKGKNKLLECARLNMHANQRNLADFGKFWAKRKRTERELKEAIED